MEELKLIIPTEEYLGQVWEYRRECLEAGSSMDGCGGLRRRESGEAWLAQIRLFADPATVPPGRIQATQLLAVRVSDNRLVGMLNVRHELDDYLLQFAGHIGYSVRPSERRKGYATEQLRQALIWCKEELGLSKVLITCNDTNEPSRRTILTNGGVFDGTSYEPDEKETVERYWIDLGGSGHE